MSNRALFIGLFALFLVLGAGFAATTFQPVYTPVPGQQPVSIEEILSNYSLDSKFAVINSRLDDLTGKVADMQAPINAQTQAFNNLAQREEDRFKQGEAIKRSDERIQSQLKGMRLFFAISVTFLTLFAVWMFRRTLDDFKNGMKAQIKEEVEADLHQTVRLALLPTKKEDAKKVEEPEVDKFGREIMPTPKESPSLHFPQSGVTQPQAQSPAQTEKKGFFSRLFSKFKRKPKELGAQFLPPEIGNIKEQIMSNQPARMQGPASSRPMTLEEKVAMLQKQNALLLARTAPNKRPAPRPKPRPKPAAKPKPASKLIRNIPANSLPKQEIPPEDENVDIVLEEK